MAIKVPVIALVCFRPGGILVCKLEGASFWEKTPGADYLPHHLTLPEGKDNSDDILYLCLSVFPLFKVTFHLKKTLE